MENNAIKEANRKAMPKFILLTIICVIIGGAGGYLSARFSLNTLSGTLRSTGSFFGTYIAPWFLIGIAVIMPVILAPCYQKANKLLEGWDGETEEVSDAIESQVSFIIWLSNAALILSYFLIAACYSKGFATFESSSKTTLLFIGIAAFVGIIPETIILQQKSVDIVKKMNPEKTASVYDMKFQKKWMDSCDEAEKLMIGKCAFKAYRSTNITCGTLAIILACCALVFDIGFLPSFCVCLIWIINHTSYCREASRLAKMGNKIS